MTAILAISHCYSVPQFSTAISAQTPRGVSSQCTRALSDLHRGYYPNTGVAVVSARYCKPSPASVLVLPEYRQQTFIEHLLACIAIMRGVFPRTHTVAVRLEFRLESKRNSMLTSAQQSRFGIGRSRKPSAVENDFPSRGTQPQKVLAASATRRRRIAEQIVTKESWEDELVNSSSIGVRYAEGANSIATWGQPRPTSINGPLPSFCELLPHIPTHIINACPVSFKLTHVPIAGPTLGATPA